MKRGLIKSGQEENYSGLLERLNCVFRRYFSSLFLKGREDICDSNKCYLSLYNLRF